MGIFDKKILKTNSTTIKDFSYSLGDVSISIKLRTDIKQELKDGKEILGRILKDIEEELK